MTDSDECNDGYKFKSLGSYLKCKNKHSKGKIIGRCIKGSYYIKCQFSPCKKEIKINNLPEMISSITSQVSRTNSTYNRSYFYKKILDQYPNLYREYSSEKFNYYGITNETSCRISREIICLLYKLGHDNEEIESRYKAKSYFIKYEQCKIEITV
jgi:hypothetical protein